jgi:tetratricopeptide (TPR) repeat protein
VSKAAKDLSIDNIKLIYEFDKTSPLFSRVASFEIEQGNYLYASEILEKGLEIYPDYPTAHIIYALSKAYAGDEHRAKESLEKAVKFFSSKNTYDFYVKKIENIITERNSLSSAKRPTFISEKNTADENVFFNIEDRLDVLAEELSKAKIKVMINEDVDEVEPPEYTGKKIASETLAGIYVAQKNYEEAISVFKELIKLHPDKEHYYTQKIVEIETKI